MEKISELEGCVLGIIWENGACTPYVIRRKFLISPNPEWSGSAGAIYPLVKRLEARGWIRSKEMETSGGRRSREYSLTAAGRKVFRSWIGPPLSLNTIGIPSDPLRTRIEFLYSLRRDERKEFLSEAIRQIREQIQIIRKDCIRRRKEGNVPAYVAGLGALRMMRARLDWLYQARRILRRKNS
jgi:DNA-binding PadR family transcriptional regulator